MIDFSLFFFSSYKSTTDNKYKLLLEAAKYADASDFNAVWTPERHFHEFGGLFPNPSVVSAALAMLTDRIAIRSGSIVSPLHDVIRIAEEWSVVDNLSKGRVGVSFASGWNGNDFILSKDNYADRHKIMEEQIETVQRLWRGESIIRKNGVGKEMECRVYPTPVQKELPIWLTSAGNEKTYIKAGERGLNLLTHLLGQDMDDLSYKISLYREAWERSGREPDLAKVTLMLHTYIGDEMREVESIIEQPFMQYLKSATNLSKSLYEEAGLNADEIPEADKEIMLMHSLKRYRETASLIGTKESCYEMVERLIAIDIDEIACLIDFGIEENFLIRGLENLNGLRKTLASTLQPR